MITDLNYKGASMVTNKAKKSCNNSQPNLFPISISVLMAFAFFSVTLTGCAGENALEKIQEQTPQAREGLIKAMPNATVTCFSEDECKKEYSRAKVYVQNNSDMRVQISDDTIVSTYGPTEYGYVSLNVAKLPGDGDTSTIQLTATCKGMNEAGTFYVICAKKLIPIYNGFKSFIQNAATEKQPVKSETTDTISPGHTVLIEHGPVIGYNAPSFSAKRIQDIQNGTLLEVILIVKDFSKVRVTHDDELLWVETKKLY